jgi:hypothetical protein
MWADTFDPARREIQRQQDLLGQQKQQTLDAWNSYNTWAEGKRATAAGQLTDAQRALASVAADRTAAHDKSIADLVASARGGAGAPPQGADLGAATGSDALTQQQASLGGVSQAQNDYRAALDKVTNQQMLDQQAIEKARVSEGMNVANTNYSRASAALAAKRGELESSIGQAKLDKFYRDRQYGLDRETLDWTKSLQGGQLDLQKQSLALEGQKLSVQQQIAAGQLSFKAAQAAIDNQFKAGRLTVQQRNSQINAAKAGAASYNNTTKNALKVVGDTKKAQADFSSVDTNAQGEYMRQGAAALHAAGIPLSIAMKHMASMYGGRWSNFPAAVKETKTIFGGK